MGSGRTRGASAAASRKPALWSVEAKCSLEHCIVITRRVVPSCLTYQTFVESLVPVMRGIVGVGVGIGAVEVDANRQCVRVPDCRRSHAHPPRPAAKADQPAPILPVVVVEDVRRPGPPAEARAGADPHSDPPIRQMVRTQSVS